MMTNANIEPCARESEVKVLDWLCQFGRMKLLMGQWAKELIEGVSWNGQTQQQQQQQVCPGIASSGAVLVLGEHLACVYLLLVLQCGSKAASTRILHHASNGILLLNDCPSEITSSHAGALNLHPQMDFGRPFTASRRPATPSRCLSGANKIRRPDSCPPNSSYQKHFILDVNATRPRMRSSKQTSPQVGCPHTRTGIQFAFHLVHLLNWRFIY